MLRRKVVTHLAWVCLLTACGGYVGGSRLAITVPDLTALGTVLTASTVSGMNFTVRNSGSFPVNLVTGSLAYPFTYSGGTFPGTLGTRGTLLNPGASCTISTSYSTPGFPGSQTRSIALPFSTTSTTVTSTQAFSSTYTHAWTWVHGGQGANIQAVHGTLGVAAASNTPGVRSGHTLQPAPDGGLYLFAGSGRDSAAATGSMNDLWKWNGSAWTWVKGSDTINALGTYGTRGTASASNTPGARRYFNYTQDPSGNVWVFGTAQGCGSAACGIDLNDLWKWDGNTWTWMTGTSDGSGQNCGTKGVTAASNHPSTAGLGTMWSDPTGTLWLFPGGGRDCSAVFATVDMVWKYEPSTGYWTWVAGDDTTAKPPVWGTQGVAATSNTFGSRRQIGHQPGCVDRNGIPWVYGGEFANSGTFAGDLWKW